MSDAVASLSPTELERKNELEGVIRLGLSTFVEVGKALAEIRDRRLYLDEYTSFADYCESEWEISKTHANRTINASKVAENVAPIGACHMKESHARELARLPENMQADVWRRVCEAGEANAHFIRHNVDTILFRMKNGSDPVPALPPERNENQDETPSTISAQPKPTRRSDPERLMSIADQAFEWFRDSGDRRFNLLARKMTELLHKPEHRQRWVVQDHKVDGQSNTESYDMQEVGDPDDVSHWTHPADTISSSEYFQEAETAEPDENDSKCCEAIGELVRAIGDNGVYGWLVAMQMFNPHLSYSDLAGIAKSLGKRFTAISKGKMQVMHERRRAAAAIPWAAKLLRVEETTSEP